MKSNNGLRNNGMKADTDEVKKTVKLSPIKKSGKDKHNIYRDLEDGDEDDYDLINYKKRESVLDYFDDEAEDFDDDDYDDDDYDEEDYDEDE